jgi:hypothetical protein
VVVTWKAGRVFVVGFVAVVALLVAREGRAASINVGSRVCYTVGCYNGLPGSGPGATSSLSYDFSANPDWVFQASGGMTVSNFDHFAARAEANIDYNLPLGEHIAVGHSTGGQGSADLFDTLLVSGGMGSGTVRMQWAITGANDIAYIGTDNVVPQADIVLSLECFASAQGQALNCPDANFSWTTAGFVDELVTIDVPILFGVPVDWNFLVRLTARIGFGADACTFCVTSFQGRSIADFGSSGQLVDVQLLDGAGNLLDPSGIQADSGFRYDLVGQSVPEPSLLALAAPLALAAARRRRS